jgi:hypothetical protein
MATHFRDYLALVNCRISGDSYIHAVTNAASRAHVKTRARAFPNSSACPLTNSKSRVSTVTLSNVNIGKGADHDARARPLGNSDAGAFTNSESGAGPLALSNSNIGKGAEHDYCARASANTNVGKGVDHDTHPILWPIRMLLLSPIPTLADKICTGISMCDSRANQISIESATAKTTTTMKKANLALETCETSAHQQHYPAD